MNMQQQDAFPLPAPERDSPCPGLTLVPESRGGPDPGPAAEPSQSGLWLCIHLPGLAADVIPLDRKIPLAITETVRNRTVVHACNEAAARRGVTAGMTLAAAVSVCGGLRNTPRDRKAECRRLNELAAGAWALSSKVCFYSGDSLVVEIRGSLKLCGGLRALVERLTRFLNGTGMRFALGIAGNARAASWLARHRPGRYVLFPDHLLTELRALPVTVLTDEADILARLERSGLRTLADVLRLPRGDLARRFGPALLHVLDQATGRESEPLALYAPPQTFEATESLAAPVTDWQWLRIPAEELLKRLEHALIRRQAATQRVDCLLVHEHEPATVIPLHTCRYERRAQRFLELLTTQFERTRLPAEVTAISMRCKELHVMPPGSLQLLDGPADTEQQWSQFLDQLTARVGEQSLAKLFILDDHRPERAGRYGAHGGTKPVMSTIGAGRPLWLLPRPALLEQNGQRPRWGGRLHLSRLPERIEQGWWDGGDVRRDYYVARNGDGTRLWVYHDRCDRRWYLHGVFA